MVRVHHGEGVATHIDPESCAGIREGTGEALTGVRIGQATEPRKKNSPGCRRRSNIGRQKAGRAIRECPAGPAWSKTLTWGYSSQWVKITRA